MSVLPIYVVYDRPKDHPDKIVVREWDGVTEKPSLIAHGFETIDLAREWIQKTVPGAHRMPRFPTDDQVVVEVWL